ncbi:hypothetical protein ACIFOE_04735 [Paenibacillus sp. NRS-1783]|uniref:hypothetical protein n=1 Tax=Paenibacillus sp. NRS-1783 TaxID=3233907 RepID=UPI003D2E4DB2
MYTNNILTNIIVLILAVLAYSIVKNDYSLLRMGVLGLISCVAIVIVAAVVMIVFNKKRRINIKND